MHATKSSIVTMRSYYIELFDEEGQPLGIETLHERDAQQFAGDHVIQRCKLCGRNFASRRYECGPRQRHEFPARQL